MYVLAGLPVVASLNFSEEVFTLKVKLINDLSKYLILIQCSLRRLVKRVCDLYIFTYQTVRIKQSIIQVIHCMVLMVILILNSFLFSFFL